MNMATVRLADAKRIEKGHHCRFRVELEALSQESDEVQRRLDQARAELRDLRRKCGEWAERSMQPQLIEEMREEAGK